MKDDNTGRVAAYAAAVLAFASAAVSLYWAFGGTLGLDTVGGQIEELARSRSASSIALVWAVVGVKTVAGVIALALVRPWGRLLPRWTLLTVGWAGSAVLVLYGGLFVATGLLVETGVVVPDGAVDWWALRWHIWLWDMWFLLWGVALAIATRQFARRSSRSSAPGRRAT